jgi:predicted transcriptional regulator
MNHKSTPDERFMIKLHQMATAKGHPHTPIRITEVARATGLKETATKNIIKDLYQANFLEKDGEMVHLTDRGCRFVEEQSES